MVARRLGEEFETQVDRSLAPDEAVAHGAALYAEFLLARSGSEESRMSIRNVNSHDLGVLAIEDATNQPRRKVQIPRNTPLPATGVSRFHTRHDDQRAVGVPVIEGGDASGRNATHIGQCVVSDLPPGLPAGTPIDVAFTYAEDGRLTVEAELPSVRRQASLVIERASGLSDEIMRQWQERIEMGTLPGTTNGEEEQSPQDQPAQQDHFTVICPNGHELSCPHSLQGKTGKCPKCGSRFVVPSLEDEPQWPDMEQTSDEPAADAATGDPDLDDFLKGLGS
jgi:molecular chaperone DnaK (HSP70)